MFLDEVYDHPSPYTPRLNRYAPEKKRPATLAQEFIRDMLEVTGAGRARYFEGIRYHAIPAGGGKARDGDQDEEKGS